MDFDITKIPKKINPCPIAEAIVELRFDSDLPADAISGIVFNALKHKYPNFENLPIMQLPAFVRDNDPQFKFNPQYRLSSKENNFIFQIGPKSFSITCPNEYPGWDEYSDQINWVFARIKELGLVKKFLRLGVRYINFFENKDIFDHIQIDFSLAKNSMIGEKNLLRSEYNFENFRCILQITNDATLSERSKGSSIDIDIIKESEDSAIFENFKTLLSSAHDVEKKVFFGILKDDFLNTFNPEYET